MCEIAPNVDLIRKIFGTRSLRSRSRPRDWTLEVHSICITIPFYQSAGIYLAAVFPFLVRTYSFSASRPSAAATCVTLC